jgi:hypothetical protein
VRTDFGGGSVSVDGRGKMGGGEGGERERCAGMLAWGCGEKL